MAMWRCFIAIRKCQAISSCEPVFSGSRKAISIKRMEKQRESIALRHSERMIPMRRWTMLIVAGLIAFSGCDGGKKPNESKLRDAINQYLQAQTRTCIAVDGKFPIDIPAGSRTGEVAELAALEHAGLVQSTNTTAVVQSLANSLSLSHKPEPVKRYTVSAEGQKYLQSTLSGAGRSDAFCYGHEQVASIVNWTEPQTQGDYSETTVTYTGKVPDLVAWARQPEVEQAFPAIGTTLDAVEKNQTVPLHLTDKGWVVNGFTPKS